MHVLHIPCNRLEQRLQQTFQWSLQNNFMSSFSWNLHFFAANPMSGLRITSSTS
jgi:hypothetical protein